MFKKMEHPPSREPEPRISVSHNDTQGLWKIETSSCRGCLFRDEYKILDVNGGELIKSSESSLPSLTPSKGGADKTTFFVRPWTSLQDGAIVNIEMIRKTRDGKKILHQSVWSVQL